MPSYFEYPVIVPPEPYGPKLTDGDIVVVSLRNSAWWAMLVVEKAGLDDDANILCLVHLHVRDDFTQLDMNIIAW